MGETATKAPEDAELELGITELVEFDPTRLDGVKAGATGIPFLIMKAAAGPADAEPDAGPGLAKGERPGWHPAAAALARMGAAAPLVPAATLYKAVAADGSVNEKPDIDGGMAAVKLIGKLIGYEADELAAGHLDEIEDVMLLTQAAECLKCWLSRERAGSMQDGDATLMDGYVMASIADLEKALLSAAERNKLPDSAFAHIEDGGKKDADGKTTPRSKRHFPIHDKAHADAAMARIEGGAEFGDQAKRKVKAAQKKFGEDGAGKSTAPVVAEDATEAHNDHDGQLSELVAAEVAKALKPREESEQALRDELAKAQAKADAAEATVKEWSSRPVHGGPVMSVTRSPVTAADGTDWTAKAAEYRRNADAISDPATADGYRQLARQADEKAARAATAAG